MLPPKYIFALFVILALVGSIHCEKQTKPDKGNKASNVLGQSNHDFTVADIQSTTQRTQIKRSVHVQRKDNIAEYDTEVPSMWLQDFYVLFQISRGISVLSLNCEAKLLLASAGLFDREGKYTKLPICPSHRDADGASDGAVIVRTAAAERGISVNSARSRYPVDSARSRFSCLQRQSQISPWTAPEQEPPNHTPPWTAPEPFPPVDSARAGPPMDRARARSPRGRRQFKISLLTEPDTTVDSARARYPRGHRKSQIPPWTRSQSQISWWEAPEPDTPWTAQKPDPPVDSAKAISPVDKSKIAPWTAPEPDFLVDRARSPPHPVNSARAKYPHRALDSSMKI
ncbi:predicted protein [Nematostella vectensis]|uniref:Uncharacterized protein n=1 Tax=Nematostella vectensis TaxID=45351 RepID=A7SAU5_NEMVE|nr:predicted protein [Nematostella vectensis]|eukprot:XP_001631248.1 predicted protein [Nematostella vectensis]